MIRVLFLVLWAVFSVAGAVELYEGIDHATGTLGCALACMAMSRTLDE